MRRDFEAINYAATRAADLTRQLLAFSRKQVFTRREVDLSQIVGAMRDLLARLIGEQIRLVIETEPMLGCIQADPVHLEQVVMNLAVNARDAMPIGGGLTIAICNHELGASAAAELEIQPGDYVLLIVSDTGRGIDEETRRHIFEPFFTTKATGKGTGLGLATVYGIVKQLNGAVAVESEPERGTTFKVYLPRTTAQPAAAQPPETVAAAQKAVKNSVVLLIEDDETVRQLTATILSESGLTALAAHDGESALRLCERHNGTIDLLLTDVILPGINGIETWRRARLIRPGLPVIFMSGYADDQLAPLREIIEKTSFIQKPFSPTALLEKIVQTLEAEPQVFEQSKS